jgi:hypothetical protein
VGEGGYKEDMIKKFGHSNFIYDAAHDVEEEQKVLKFNIPEPVPLASFVIDFRVCPQDADLNTCRLGKQRFIREANPRPAQTPRRFDREITGVLRVYSGNILSVERFITKEMERTLEKQTMGAAHLGQLAYQAAQDELAKMLKDPEKGIPDDHEFGDARDDQARRRYEEIKARAQKPIEDNSMPQESERLPPLIETKEFSMGDQRKICMDIIASKLELLEVYELDRENEEIKDAIEFLIQQYDKSKCNEIL